MQHNYIVTLHESKKDALRIKLHKKLYDLLFSFYSYNFGFLYYSFSEILPVEP
jgi:hypothetical protein